VVWAIWQIFIVCNECYDYAHYFHEPNTTKEIIYIERSKDFRFFRQILWQMTIIELSKLFCSSSQRDRYNLFHLINRLEKNAYYGKLSFDTQTLSKWKIILNKNQGLIENILILRDKFYAHSDPQNEKYSGRIITFKEIKGLLLFVEEVIKEIYHQIFHSEAHIDNLFFDKNNFDLINLLIGEKSRKIDELIWKTNERKD
jgi:hypothetical protein